MKQSILLALLIAAPAQADDCQAMKAKLQAMMDALVPGDRRAWVAALDPRFTMIDEAGAISNYKQSIDQVRPLPKGLSGNIAVTEWACTLFGDALSAPISTTSMRTSTARSCMRSTARRAHGLGRTETGSWSQCKPSRCVRTRQRWRSRMR